MVMFKQSNTGSTSVMAIFIYKYKSIYTISRESMRCETQGGLVFEAGTTHCFFKLYFVILRNVHEID